MSVCAAVFLMKHGLSEALLTQYSAYFLMPPLVLFWIFFFVLVMTQIVAFRKGLTPYLKWCCVFSIRRAARDDEKSAASVRQGRRPHGKPTL